MLSKKLPNEFFKNENTLVIAKNLLGKSLVSLIDNCRTSGIIIETEAYLGENDRASHAFGLRRSKRTEVLYGEGGHLYIYLCYGMHSLLNIVTQKLDEPHGVLIRALHPIEGIEMMLKRRKAKKVTPTLTSGPGALTQALGITTAFTGHPIGKTIWVEDVGIHFNDDQILITPRIGVDYAKEDALLPYRFRVKPGIIFH